jgi:hypothetical protein
MLDETDILSFESAGSSDFSTGAAAPPPPACNPAGRRSTVEVLSGPSLFPSVHRKRCLPGQGSRSQWPLLGNDGPGAMDSGQRGGAGSATEFESGASVAAHASDSGSGRFPAERTWTAPVHHGLLSGPIPSSSHVRMEEVVPPPDAHATLVVVGPDGLEHQYAFDALIDDTDGIIDFFFIFVLWPSDISQSNFEIEQENLCLPRFNTLTTTFSQIAFCQKDSKN